jgi:hypothetical protein
MLAGIFEEHKLHSIFASWSTKLRIVVIIFLILIDLIDKFINIGHFLIVPGLDILAVPEITKDNSFGLFAYFSNTLVSPKHLNLLHELGMQILPILLTDKPIPKYPNNLMVPQFEDGLFRIAML